MDPTRMLKTHDYRIASTSDNRDTTERRALGIYYTPHRVSSSLCDWAVRRDSDRVLEPSFGGCVFLVEAAAALRERGAQRPFAQLYGCDVDRRAFRHLEKAFPKRNVQSRFVRKDFLCLVPGEGFPSGVNAIVGNPPYVSHHNMTDAQRTSARLSAASGPLKIRGTASLWAHFVNHSLNFLSDRGRIAMVLPGTAFRTDYGQAILLQLSRRFRQVDVIQLQERVFESQGIQDMPAILLCDGWNEAGNKRPAALHRATSMESCRQQILELRRPNGSRSSQVDARLESAMMAFRKMGHSSLGDLAIIRIGMVTGANAFFALKPSDCQRLGLPPAATTPFFSQISMSPALEVCPTDIGQAVARDDRCQLLNPAEPFQDDKAVRRYLNSFSKDERNNNKTFRKRSCWYRPAEGETPDAFLTYMNAQSARLVLNTARLQSLNNIHRIYFKPKVNRSQRILAALAILSTPGQLAAELLGRSYSGGVLKLEPSDAARLPIPNCDRSQARAVETAWSQVNAHLRSGAYEAAVYVADAVISLCAPGIDDALRASQGLLETLRRARLQRRTVQAATS